MTGQDSQNENALNHLADALAEDVATLRDDIALAEVAEDYGEPRVLTSRFDKLFNDALWTINVRRVQPKRQFRLSTVVDWVRAPQRAWAVSAVLLFGIVSQTGFYLARPSTHLEPKTQSATQFSNLSPTRGLGPIENKLSPGFVAPPSTAQSPQISSLQYPDSTAIVRFVAQANSSEITKLLIDYKVSIVAGPFADGSFRIQLPTATSNDQNIRLVQQLQVRKDIVEFVHALQ